MSGLGSPASTPPARTSPVPRSCWRMRPALSMPRMSVRVDVLARTAEAETSAATADATCAPSGTADDGDQLIMEHPLGALGENDAQCPGAPVLPSCDSPRAAVVSANFFRGLCRRELGVPAGLTVAGVCPAAAPVRLR